MTNIKNDKIIFFWISEKTKNKKGQIDRLIKHQSPVGYDRFELMVFSS